MDFQKSESDPNFRTESQNQTSRTDHDRNNSELIFIQEQEDPPVVLRNNGSERNGLKSIGNRDDPECTCRNCVSQEHDEDVEIIGHFQLLHDNAQEFSDFVKSPLSKPLSFLQFKVCRNQTGHCANSECFLRKFSKTQPNSPVIIEEYMEEDSRTFCEKELYEYRTAETQHTDKLRIRRSHSETEQLPMHVRNEDFEQKQKPNLTAIDEDPISILPKKDEFLCKIDSLKNLKLAPLRIYPVGEATLAKYVLGDHGKTIRKIQGHVKAFTKTRNFSINVNLEANEIVVRIEEKYRNFVSNLLEKIIQRGREEMAKEEEIWEIGEGKSCLFAMGCGGVVRDVILPGEFREIEIESRGGSWYTEGIAKMAEEYGNLLHTKVLNDKRNPCLVVTYSNVASAQKVASSLRKLKYISVTERFPTPAVDNEQSPDFYLQISWPRSSYCGWMKFYSPTQCHLAYRAIKTHRLVIKRKTIILTLMIRSEMELLLTYKPTSVNIEGVMISVMRSLPQNIKPRWVCFEFSSYFRATESEVRDSKAKLNELFSKYVPSSEFSIDLETPNAGDFRWFADVRFVSFKRASRTMAHLEGGDRIGNHRVQMEPIFETGLDIETGTYRALKKDIAILIQYLECRNIYSGFRVLPQKNASITQIVLSSRTAENLREFKKQIIDLIQHHRKCYQDMLEDYHNLFPNKHKFLKKIQVVTSPPDVSDNADNIPSITLNSYCFLGSYYDMQSVMFREENLCNLRDKNVTPDFQKSVQDVWCRRRILNQEEYSKNSGMVENDVDDPCWKSSDTSSNEASVHQETCPICLDFVDNTEYYRLENCCHLFCKHCLLFHIQTTANVPLVCLEKDCAKLFLIEDFRRLFIGFDEWKKEFFHKALKKYVSTNGSDVRCCVTPDCKMVYRVNSNPPEIPCPLCKNNMCTRCHDTHNGISCDKFQKKVEREKNFFKIWLEEDPENRKRCPACSVPIEVSIGCCHIICAHCNVHMCWRCLKTFRTSSEVYRHFKTCENIKRKVRMIRVTGR